MANQNPRRRRLPALGVTTVGLAVSAGSLGLYQGAAADQPAWAAVPPTEPNPDAQVSGPPAPPVVAPVVPPQPTTEWPVLGPPPVLPLIPPPAPATAATEAAPMPRVHLPPPARPEVHAVPVAASPLQIEPAVVARPAQPLRSAEVPPPAAGPQPELSLPPAIGPSNLGVTAAPAATPAPPGDSPMIPKLSAVRSAVVGAALAAGPAGAQDAIKSMPASEAAPKTAETVDELKRQLTDATDKARALELRVKLMEDELLGTKVKETGMTVPGLRQKFDDMVKKFDALQTKYAALETRVGDTARSASAYPNTPGTVPTGPKATVRISNEYGVPITLILNGLSHRVEPGGSKSVEVPAGTYTYELLNGATGAAETKPIKDGDAVNLRIR